MLRAMLVNAYAALERGQNLVAWNYESADLKPHEVMLRVLACGLCHSDLHMIDNDWKLTDYPLVPGHEIVGEVLEKGSALSHLKSGQRVGVGWQRSSCLHCEDCLRGNENLCDANTGLITHGHGGFANHVLVDGRFCFPLDDGLPTEFAGPLMCGGITVYSGLRYAGMTSGQRIGIIGVGGLGHLAVQFASKLGNTVTVFTTSDEKAHQAARLGAHESIIVRRGALAHQPKKPLDLILSTVPTSIPCELYLDLLGSDGTLCFVGVPNEPLAIPLFPLLLKRRRVMASPIGGRAMMRAMLDLATRFGIQPTIERFPMSEVNTAIAKLRRNSLRYRAVLVN
jgi:alcohol/geraniol dehydrogenase (NADP+)